MHSMEWCDNREYLMVAGLYFGIENENKIKPQMRGNI